jgi:hypothetical protein
MPPIAYHPADADLVRRILRETGVATKPSGPPLTSYLGAWMEALARWFSRFFAERPGMAGTIVNAAAVIAILTLAAALILVALSIVRRARNRGPREAPAPGLGGAGLRQEAPSPRDRAAWRAEIEARLSRGYIAGALEAFWWWLASSLPLESGIDASWTTRELLVKARRHELLGLGGTLDVLMYGPRIPSPESVTACLARFEEKLA